MKITVGGEKGGTGKSTMATNIAAILAGMGRDVLVVDTDPQNSLADWAQVRGENDSVPKFGCVSIYGKGLTKEIIALSKKYQDIVIDAGGRESAELRAAMVASDVILMPMQPSSFDLWTASKMSELVELSQSFNPELTAYAFISRDSTNAWSNDANEAKDLLKDYPNINVLSSTIKNRVSFARATSSGLSVIEMNSDKSACLEMANLFKELMQKMGANDLPELKFETSSTNEIEGAK